MCGVEQGTSFLSDELSTPLSIGQVGCFTSDEGRS